MKKKSERLKVVLELAVRKETVALEELTKKSRYLDQQQSQLENLMSYQTQSMQELKSGLKEVHDVWRLQSSQHFIEQVAQAIQQQGLVNDGAKREYAQALGVWAECHHKSKGMSDLIHRYHLQEQSATDKKIEKQIEDEFISRRYH